ncbi:Cupin 1 [Penicillium expansum]|uniref:Cupin 1 n=1 Tax=Penicillium expansum TaxID=27334 RepID=A0A0A2KTM8_PENEN|nr:Cupin 1 [Penicillium expansum]KGO48302.1 Cupin 1 [Penicillium expansum]KGO53782.1 Cupin 1 [Penicillium expansum]KGO70303.1 Cupin 1 [Penicillium expansum]
MAVEVRKYHLLPTNLIPNSPRPLLHYKNVLPKNIYSSHCDPGEVWQIFTKNGWKVNWLFRYSDTQLSHYHSNAHECMAVLSGTASIRFGVADMSADMHENTYNSAWEEGGLVLEAEAGDVFIIPAGVAHKTHNTFPKADFALLSPGKGHGIEADDPKKELSEIKLNGFTMMGAYSGGDWDFIATGGNFERVWAVQKPKYDPVFGSHEMGLCARWHGSNQEPKARL